MRKKALLIIISILLVVSLTSCAFIQRSTIKKQIVTTLYPEYDMVNKIIGTDQETQFRGTGIGIVRNKDMQ